MHVSPKTIIQDNFSELKNYITFEKPARRTVHFKSTTISALDLHDNSLKIPPRRNILLQRTSLEIGSLPPHQGFYHRGFSKGPNFHFCPTLNPLSTLETTTSTHRLQLLDHRWSIRQPATSSITIFGGQTQETKPLPDSQPRILTSPDHATLSPALRFLPKFPINYFGNPALYNPWGPTPFPTSVRFKSKPEFFPDTV